MKVSSSMLASCLNIRSRHVTSGQPRGVAMLLVLISLMMATVLASSYLASRDNSSMIGANVASAAAARWTADSGLEMALAVLQTESDWRTSHITGRLVSNYPLGGGLVDIDLVDIETGLPPNTATEYVWVTAKGTVDGVNQTSVAECRVPRGTGDEMDLDLSEFAAFASERLTMADSATIARWPMAPLSTLGRRVRLGTRAISSSSVDLDGDSASIDTTVYHGPGASASLVVVASTQVPEQTALLDHIPMPAAPSSGVANPASPSAAADLNQTSGNAITSTSVRWRNVNLSNTAVRMLRGTITVISDEDLRLTNGAKLLIDGQVKLVVFGDTVIDAGAIELRPGARLRMFVRGRTESAFDVRDGYIGDQRATPTLDATGKANYMDPERVLIFSMPGGDPASTWSIGSTSVLKTSMYVPDAVSVALGDTSAIYGRIASKQLSIRQNSAVFYDPALDSRAGYTNPESAMWEADGTMKAEVKSITSLDSTVLQAVADTLGKVVLALTGSESNYEPSSGTSTSTTTVSPTDPTPRPIEIETRYIAFGNALDQWE